MHMLKTTLFEFHSDELSPNFNESIDVRFPRNHYKTIGFQGE